MRIKALPVEIFKQDGSNQDLNVIDIIDGR
jgi:hypothetical protein